MEKYTLKTCPFCNGEAELNEKINGRGARFVFCKTIRFQVSKKATSIATR